MKDGPTQLAHKVEHAVDLDTVAVTLREADKGDTTTLDRTLCEAGETGAELAGREPVLTSLATDQDPLGESATLVRRTPAMGLVP